MGLARDQVMRPDLRAINGARGTRYADRNLLPAGPLLAAIDAAGGVRALVLGRDYASTGGHADFYDADDDPLVVTPEQDREIDSLQTAVRRMRKAGSVYYVTADNICCRYLGMHPLFVFG